MTFLTHSFGQGRCDCGCIAALWSLQLCVRVCLRTWLGCWSVWIQVKALVCVCVFVLAPALLHFQTILMPSTAAMHSHISLLTCTYTHAYTYRPCVCALMPIFVCVTLSDLCSYLLLSLLRCQSHEQSWCEQWIETEQLHYQRSRCKKKNNKSVGNKWGGGQKRCCTTDV